MAPSLYRFFGRFHPEKVDSGDIHSVDLELNIGRTTLEIEGQEVRIQLIAEPYSFEALFSELKETIQSFLAAQSLTSHYPLRILWHEWHEFPLDTDPSVANEPVRGEIITPDKGQTEIPNEALSSVISRGMEWYKEFEHNPFLKRAIKDFSYALEQPKDEVPVYLYRAIESAQVHFGGEDK